MNPLQKTWDWFTKKPIYKKTIELMNDWAKAVEEDQEIVTNVEAIQNRVTKEGAVIADQQDEDEIRQKVGGKTLEKGGQIVKEAIDKGVSEATKEKIGSLSLFGLAIATLGGKAGNDAAGEIAESAYRLVGGEANLDAEKGNQFINIPTAALLRKTFKFEGVDDWGETVSLSDLTVGIDRLNLDFDRDKGARSQISGDIYFKATHTNLSKPDQATAAFEYKIIEHPDPGIDKDIPRVSLSLTLKK